MERTAAGPWRTFLHRLAGVVAAVLLLVALGTVAFIRVGGWPPLDALWMTIITVTAVGYEEVRPLDHGTRVVASFLLAGGITLMGVWFAALTAAIVETDLGHIVRTRRDMKKLEQLTDHVIVCGGGDTGRHVVAELQAADVAHVIIERDAERAEEIRFRDERTLVLVADGTRDESLVTAGIGRARGLVACLSKDTDNLFVCLSARDLQPRLTIVARAYDEQTMQKMHVAGANHVVSPNVTGGIRMASVLLRPQVVSFLDVVARSEGLALRLEEIAVADQSPLAGKSLAKARIPQRTGLIVIAIQHESDDDRSDWRYNPGPGETLNSGDSIIVLGKAEQIDALTRLAGA